MGFPTDNTRAILRIAAANVTTAVLMRDYDAAVLSNVIVDGNRGALGAGAGDALIYAGGFSDGQIIRGNKIMNTRSWSSLQLIEGFSESQPCQKALLWRTTRLDPPAPAVTFNGPTASPWRAQRPRCAGT